MEEHSMSSPQVEPSVDGVEAKHISGLSTIMVATIQEAKDRISQIEYIFCSQLFPTFQSKSKTLDKVYSEAHKAAKEAWEETQKGLLCEIEELKLRNQRILDENRALKLEKEEQFHDLESITNLILKVRTQQEKIEELELELKRKSKEADDGMALHNRLVQLVQVKTSDLLNKDKQLKEHEEEINMLLAQVKSLERKTIFLQDELSRKTLVEENLRKKLEYVSIKATEGEHRLGCLEEEKERLITRLQIFEENVGRLEELLRQKTDELEDGRKMLEGFRQKLNRTETELQENKQQVGDNEREKKMLLEKVMTLEKEVNKMHIQLEEEGWKEGRSSELVLERKRRKEAYDAYKRLKSQYNFLCKRFGLTADAVLHQGIEEGKHLEQNESPAISLVPKRKKPDTCVSTGGADNVGNHSGSEGGREKERVIKTVEVSVSSPNTAGLGSTKHGPSDAKFARISGSKRSAASWRDTRSRQSPDLRDPHDDFLDTPFENIRKGLNKGGGEEKEALSEVKKHDSDEETQDINPNPSPTKKRIQVVGTSSRDFKYVAAVRKKSEREKLKGIECKQCKKFYDAVLPEIEGEEESDEKKKSFRCEHHEGVSRHRYKYAPPMTPEGFWNIGFESEM